MVIFGPIWVFFGPILDDLGPKILMFFFISWNQFSFLEKTVEIECVESHKIDGAARKQKKTLFRL